MDGFAWIFAVLVSGIGLLVVGVFLMARLWPVLSGTPEWFMILGIAGMTPFVLGAHHGTALLLAPSRAHLGRLFMGLDLDGGIAGTEAAYRPSNCFSLRRFAP
ncbi:hypothetical protein AB4099_27425 [Bosea sp. 2KB_26]|uniref:hypothetical protein n=1 Tax=Bosea sp. 2KB_26 TaxID=3237475 RepID=UPI003F9367F9